MQTLSYGYLKPQDQDSGQEVFPALESNIQRLNDHSHNGVNAAVLAVSSVAVTTQSILSGAWVSNGAGYRQAVTIPASLTGATPAQTYDMLGIEFRLSTGERVYPRVEKISDSQYYVYVNDNTLNLTAIYHT